MAVLAVRVFWLSVFGCPCCPCLAVHVVRVVRVVRVVLVWLSVLSLLFVHAVLCCLCCPSVHPSVRQSIVELSIDCPWFCLVPRNGGKSASVQWLCTVRLVSACVCLVHGICVRLCPCM